MSGTSVDAVDFCVCKVSPGSVTPLAFWSRKFPQAMRSGILKAIANQLSSYDVSQLHHDLGRFYAEAARSGLKKQKIDLVGLHGQTIFHNPARKNPATVQIGESAYLVEELGVPVINNFRVADLAAGGQGAPLASLFHLEVFGRKNLHVCVNNLGGISNVTSIDWKTSKREPKVRAFDTGPANVLVDLAVQHFSKNKKSYDENGAWARRGITSEKFLKHLLRHSYFKKSPPKSTGRELFSCDFFEQILKDAARVKTPLGTRLTSYDLVSTLTDLTAQSIALNYRSHLSSKPDIVVLSGGGAQNPELVKRIKLAMHKWDGQIKVTTSEALNWNSQWIEAAAFALLAYRRWNNLPGNLPETTGASREAVLGQMAIP